VRSPSLKTLTGLFLLAYPIMHTAIGLDHQAEFVATKIGDVLIDRV
jgi:hypothetical protein